MPWVLLVIFGAVLNVAVNSGYKFSVGTIGVEWTASLVFLIGSICLLSYSILSRKSGWENLRSGRTPLILPLISCSIVIVMACFVQALGSGPISLVDPLWACIYALVSLFVGMLIVKESPGWVAIGGVLLYLGGAALMGFSQYSGAASQNGNYWAALVLVGASLNVAVNYTYRSIARKIDMHILIGVVWLMTSVLTALYASYFHPILWSESIEKTTILTVLAMGVSTPIFMMMMMKALLKGPFSLVDPLWACIYSLASVAVGMLAMSETPSNYALCGVGLYIVGAVLMSAQKRNFQRLSPIPATEPSL